MINPKRIEKVKTDILSIIRVTDEPYLLQEGYIDSWGFNVVEFLINEQCKQGYKVHSIMENRHRGAMVRYSILFEKL